MENKRISRRNFIAKGLAGLVGFGLVRDVLANELALDINSSVNNSECRIVHNNLIGDKAYNFGPEPIIDCYVYTNEQELGRDGEPANSLETKTVYITGRNLTVPTPADVSDDIRKDILDQENMVNKKITMKLYERIDNGSGGFSYAQVGIYSGWNMHESGQPIQLLTLE